MSEAARSNSGTRLVEAAKLHQQVAAHAGQEGIALEGGLCGQPIDQLQTGSGTEGHAEGDRPVQLHNRRRSKLGERIVERQDAHPIGLLRGARPGVTGSDGGLKRVRTERFAQLLSPLRGRQARDR